jgi:hypothetical protein
MCKALRKKEKEKKVIDILWNKIEKNNKLWLFVKKRHK